jgi:cytidylate kinase
VLVPDRPGVLAEVTTLAGELGVNIYDLEIAHSAEGPRGVLVLVVDAAVAETVVTAAIRTPQVDAAVSAVAAIPAVRAGLVERQRAWARDGGGAVVEGRDIGSVVFPAARLKVFLTADPAERARRRLEQIGPWGGDGESS